MPVDDSFYFVRQPLTGNGSITVQVTSLTGLLPPANPDVQVGPNGPADTRPGLVPWAKAGLIIKNGTGQGSAYAAMMVTADHGVRMQDDYTNDTAGQPGAVSTASPRWLRLTRSGDTITGYDSADGTHWTQVGTVHLAGLSSTVQAGLFATSPAYTVESQGYGGGTNGSSPSQQGHGGLRSPQPVRHVTGRHVDRRPHRSAADGVGEIGGYYQAGGQFTVTGSGDIAPVIAGSGNEGDPDSTLTDYLAGACGASGYFPLAPWAGLAVLCAYAALALSLAIVLLRRRDA